MQMSENKPENNQSSHPLELLAKSPAVFFVPVAFVAVFAVCGAASHVPPQVDTSAYETPEVPVAIDLQTRELPEEKGGSATLELTMPAAALDGRLKDGTYTGSALCGLGNDEDWAPTTSS